MESVLEFIGGIALFLYGMNAMSGALRRLSGERLEGFLARACRTPLRGVLFGALVTAAIQSSSATTVMVVGFVNAGVMSLSHAVGVIMGANLGTTATAWLLSLSGVSGEVPLFLLLRPQTLSPLLLAVGVVLILAPKFRGLCHVGQGLCGFGILFAGMEAMSLAVAPLAQNPRFGEILTLFENPLAGIAAGALLTAILQSSSASVGILQALCATGAVRLSLAVGVVMGQNVGTCVTALVSSVGSEANARRAALVHLYFNVGGIALLLPVFFGLRALGLLSGAAFVSEGDVALIHTLFNVFTTLALLPFHRLLLRAATATVSRDGKGN